MEYLKQLNELYSFGKLIEIKRAELEGKTKENGELIEDLKSYLIFLVAGGMLGLLFCFFGFVLWYKVVQRPSDLLLKAQVERSLMEQQARQKEADHGKAQKASE